MSEHERQELEELEDLEPTAEQAEQVAGGAPSVSEIMITKPVDTASPKIYP
jgi:type VI protein secretion system component Hcp